MKVYCCPSCMSELPSHEHETVWGNLCRLYFEGAPQKFNCKPDQISGRTLDVLTDLEQLKYIITHETKDEFHVRLNGINYTEDEMVFCMDFDEHNQGAA